MNKIKKHGIKEEGDQNKTEFRHPPLKLLTLIPNPPEVESIYARQGFML
ncbi:MAG: hypothetical protein IPH36_18765 [Saprospiraceae bacterium]|nr:hypothetical protein [Saprospiraceae bacterium]